MLFRCLWIGGAPQDLTSSKRYVPLFCRILKERITFAAAFVTGARWAGGLTLGLL